MTVYFVDSVGGSDSNAGVDNIGVGLLTATWTESTLTLTQVGHGYTFTVGDIIRILTGTGVSQTGAYEVVSSTADDIVLAGTSQYRDILDADDFAAGDLATGDITSTNVVGFATIDKAMNEVSAGDTVYIKASANYNETATIDTSGTGASPIRWVGYTSIINDRGKVTIDGQATRTNCMDTSLGLASIFNVFENFIFEDATAEGVDLPLTRQLMFKDCEFNNNGGHGIDCNIGLATIGCIFSANTLDGAHSTTTAMHIHSKFLDNVQDGISLLQGVVVGCVFSGNGFDNINMNTTTNQGVLIYGNTIDGDSKNSGKGVDFSSGVMQQALVNNIIYDCTTGVDGGIRGGQFINRNNLLNSNTTDYPALSEYQTFHGEQTGAPDFVDEASDDYRLNGQSPAKKTGHDTLSIGGGTDGGLDIGAVQSVGGGLLAPNKRGGKQ